MCIQQYNVKGVQSSPFCLPQSYHYGFHNLLVNVSKVSPPLLHVYLSPSLPSSLFLPCHTCWTCPVTPVWMWGIHWLIYLSFMFLTLNEAESTKCDSQCSKYQNVMFVHAKLTAMMQTVPGCCYAVDRVFWVVTYKSKSKESRVSSKNLQHLIVMLSLSKTATRALKMRVWGNSRCNRDRFHKKKKTISHRFSYYRTYNKKYTPFRCMGTGNIGKFIKISGSRW